jgi:hypothetical protein
METASNIYKNPKSSPAPINDKHTYFDIPALPVPLPAAGKVVWFTAAVIGAERLAVPGRQSWVFPLKY